MATKESGARPIYRNNTGTKREEWYNWPWCPFEEMDSPLNVQEWIQQCIHYDPTDIDLILNCPNNVEEGVWKYEQLRQFCMELNGLAVLLQEECRPETCTQMTATDQWIFLCAAHKNPKECSAIDYTRHTLDGAASLLNSTRYFPSRLSIKESSIAKIGSICRRIYRIFSHAYFHHRKAVFDPFENETHLCKRFTTFVMRYELMAQDHLIVPILSEQITATKSGGGFTTTTTASATISTSNVTPNHGVHSSPGSALTVANTTTVAASSNANSTTTTSP